MRVLLVTKPLVAPWTDSGKLVPRALARSSSGRHAFQVLVTGDETGDWPAWVEPVRLYRDSGHYRPGAEAHLRMMFGVWRRRRTFDLLHFFFQPHPSAVRAARLLARLCGRRCVHTVLSAPLVPAPDLLFADRTVTLTRATAAAFHAAGGTTQAVIPPAIEPAEPVAPGRIAAAREAAGIAGRFLLYPGDFEFSGGHDLLIDVWETEHDLPTLLMSGRAKTPRAAGARAALEAQVATRGLASRVRFAETVPDMPALIAASEAVLFPARSLHAKTDLPLVVLEAWREGRPVLASNLAPLAETIGEGGRVLPLERNAWIPALRALPETGGRMGAAGRLLLETRYSASAAALAYEALYDDVGRALSKTEPDA